MPIAWWTPTIAPTNAAFFTGSLLPQSRNDLIFGAYNDHRLRELKLTSSGTAVVNNTVLLTAPDAILDVEMGRDGFLWVTTPTTIYRLLAAPPIISTRAEFMITRPFPLALPTAESADARNRSATP